MHDLSARTLWRALLIAIVLLIPCLLVSRVAAGSGKEKTRAFDQKTLPANSNTATAFLTTL